MSAPHHLKHDHAPTKATPDVKIHEHRPSPRRGAVHLQRYLTSEITNKVIVAGLQLAPAATAIVRSRILFHDDQPVELSASYYPADIADNSSLAKAAKIRGGAPQALADLRFPQRTFVDRISAQPPTVEEVETLDLPDGTPVIRQLRVTYTDKKCPVEASVLIKGAHLYELLYQQTVEIELG